jgi:hypothetical protein
MIHEVDETLRGIVKRDVINGSDIEVVFDAPTKDWASRRNTPTIDIYLYDIREDTKRRQAGLIDVKDDTGRITGRRPMPRVYKFSYLITAWTQRPEDEHRLLSSMLACFLRNDRIPLDWLAGSLQENGWPLDVTIGLPPPEDRALSDVWSALGGELKPSLDLVVTTPIDTERFIETATPVDAPPKFNWSGSGLGGGQSESVQQGPGSDGSTEVARVMRLTEKEAEEATAGNGKKG